MKNRSFALQFRMTLVLIVLSTIIATLITYIAAAVLFISAVNENKLNPENYYEQQIPRIKEYIQETKTTILSSPDNDLRDMVQGDNFLYQAVDSDGNILYGTYGQDIFHAGEKLYQSLNMTFPINGYYVYVIPVIDNAGRIEGAISLLYTINFFHVNNNKWVSIAFILVLLSPFIYVILFTVLFSRVFAKNISNALQILIEGAQQIKNKNLDFDINYRADNELGKLCTAFLEMKEELKKSLSAQWKLEQERVEIVEALAHDLKSPLSIIKAYSEALYDDTDVDEEQRQYLAVIEENVEKSVSLVQQMQYTSDLEYSSVSLEGTPVDLEEFLTHKVIDYQLRAKKQHISVNLQFKNEIPQPVLIDADKLERILDNIVLNSMQYTPNDGSIEIIVTSADSRIYYSVCDNGTGFSPKDIEKAFDRFYRADEARQTQGGHSGLGLYIVKQLIELLGGSIQIKNLETGGACVEFWHNR